MDYSKYNALHNEYHNGYELFIISQIEPKDVPEAFFKTFIEPKSQSKIEELIANIFNMVKSSQIQWVETIYSNYYSGAKLVVGDDTIEAADTEEEKTQKQRPILNLSEIISRLFYTKSGINFTEEKKIEVLLCLLGIEIKKKGNTNFRLDKSSMDKIKNLLVISKPAPATSSSSLKSSQIHTMERVIGLLSKSHLAKDAANMLGQEERKVIYNSIYSKQSDNALFSGNKTRGNYLKFLEEIRIHNANQMFSVKELELEYVVKVCKKYNAGEVLKSNTQKSSGLLEKSDMLQELKGFCIKSARGDIKSSGKGEAKSVKVAIAYLFMLASWVHAKKKVINTNSHDCRGRGNYQHESAKAERRIESIRWAKIERMFNSFGGEVLKAFHIPVKQRAEILLEILEIADKKPGEEKNIQMDRLEQTLALSGAMRRAKMQGLATKENTSLKFKL